MDRNQALQIAIDTILGKQRPLNYYQIDANCAVLVPEDQRTPHQIRALKEVKRLTKAIQVLETYQSQKQLF